MCAGSRFYFYLGSVVSHYWCLTFRLLRIAVVDVCWVFCFFFFRIWLVFLVVLFYRGVSVLIFFVLSHFLYFFLGNVWCGWLGSATIWRDAERVRWFCEESIRVEVILSLSL